MNIPFSRRDVIQAALAAAVVVPAGASGTARARGAAQGVVPEWVPERIQTSRLRSLQIGGIFSERLEANAVGRLRKVDANVLLSGFIGRNNGSKGQLDNAWVGEHAGKFLDAACQWLQYREDTELRATVDRVARTLISTQEPDGYLGTYPPNQRWEGWDVWVHKYNLIGLLSYYETTGDAAALDACRKMGDLLVRTFGDAPGMRDIIAAGEHKGMAATSVLEPVCSLYRFTGDKKYLEFCQYIVRAYEQPDGPKIVTALLDHGSVYRTANGKAYEMLSNFNGLVDLYRLTGEEKLLTAVLRGWQDIVKHQLYFTGTVSAAEHFQKPGQLLALRSSNVGETCATVTWLQLNLRLFKLTGKARFGQEIERTVYNHLLAAQNVRNGDFCYYTSLIGQKEYTDKTLCCVSSGPRGISLLPQLIWGLDGDTFIVNLYTAAQATFEVQGVPVRIVSETQFPEEGTIALTINPDRAVPFTLRLRVPEWATRFDVSVGGRTRTGTPGQMLEVTRTWKPASALKIVLSLPTRGLSGAPTYPQYYALQRGPQVLALESALNTPDTVLYRAALPELPQVPSSKPVTAPASWTAQQVFEVDAIARTSQGDKGRQSLYFAPFADAIDYQVLLPTVQALPAGAPPATAFARACASSAERENTRGPECLTDENAQSYCMARPVVLSGPSYLTARRGKSGDPVWFCVMLDSPKRISRVVFRHGPFSETGGWFDTSSFKPRIEVVTNPAAITESRIPFSYYFIDEPYWQNAVSVAQYPKTDSSAPPPEISADQTFEVLLPQPQLIYAVRIVGGAGGSYTSCAELSAYV
jgi:uncharacterized protein